MVGGQIRIKDQPPLIFHPARCSARGLQGLPATRRSRTIGETLPDDRRALLDRYRLVDVAIKVVGIGSVGRYCAIGLFMSAANEPLFLQFKQAVPRCSSPTRARASMRIRASGW